MNLRGAVLATLAYYDALDFAMEKEEIFRFLIRFRSDTSDRFLVTQETVNNTLADIVREGTAGNRDNFHYLFDRDYLAPLRRARQRRARRKWARAAWAARWLARTPYIRAIFASGSLALSYTDELSDLDIIVITRNGRIWSARLFASLTLSILHIRRTFRDKRAPDKVCPNHFITDQSLSIPFRSIYTAQLYASMVPLWAADQTLLEQFRMENEWIFHFLYHWQMPEQKIKKSSLATASRVIGETTLDAPFGNIIEWLARWYQKRRIARHGQTGRLPAGRQGHIIYNDSQLAFHEGSSEAAVIDKYNKNLAKLGLLT